MPKFLDVPSWYNSQGNLCYGAGFSSSTPIAGLPVIPNGGGGGTTLNLQTGKTGQVVKWGIAGMPFFETLNVVCVYIVATPNAQTQWSLSFMVPDKFNLYLNSRQNIITFLKNSGFTRTDYATGPCLPATGAIYNGASKYICQGLFCDSNGTNLYAQCVRLDDDALTVGYLLMQNISSSYLHIYSQKINFDSAY